MKTSLAIILFAIQLILIGCAHVVSHVTSFHELPSNGLGQTYKFLPLEGQEGSLEYEAYAKRISKKLEVYGYILKTEGIDPDYFVVFNYGIGDGGTITGSLPIYGQTGGGTSYTSGTVSTNYGGYGSYSGTTYSMPTFGQVGSIPYSIRQHDRVLNLKVISYKEAKDGKAKVLYEGRVQSSGSSGEIAVVLPSMIEALFRDFPGNSGKTKIITTELLK
jgi:hypothetical protein